MKRYLSLIILLIPIMSMAQNVDPWSHRGVQYAASGTDFWVCFPRTLVNMLPNFSRLYVVSERDCDVTVSNDWLGISQTYHIMRRQMCNIDTNYLQIHIDYTRILDTIPYIYLPVGTVIGPVTYHPAEPRHNYSGVPGDLPQPRGFHVTSTDTISLYVVVVASSITACTVLPTEMLRDEYIAQPPIVNHNFFNVGRPPLPLYLPGKASIDIVAADDSVTVDIVLSDWDWTNRHPGDTVTVMLRRGQLFHLAAGEVQDKYYPLLAPYYNLTNYPQNSPNALPVAVRRHNFAGDTVMRDTFSVDLAGTHIKARDCKRIAVFESTGTGGTGVRGSINYNVKIEQSVPIFFAGKEYLVPAVDSGNYVRITALDEGANVTIRDMAHPEAGSRTLSIPPNQTDWWEGENGRGPFYITSDKPVLLKWIGVDICTINPTEWWHGGQIKYGTITNVMPINNVVPVASQLHIFTRTENIHSMYMDSYRIDTSFVPLEGTPYSYAYFNSRSHFNSMGTHYILSRTQAPFMAFLQTGGTVELQHIQPSGVFLTVNDRPADSLPSDSIWCMYDPVTFNAWNVRPCDSLIWDFGDGTVLRYSYSDQEFEQPQVYTWHDTGRFTVRAVFKYQDEGCFTRKSDTLSAPIWIHNHYDSTFSVRLCEGSFTFRGHVLDYTDTHYVTTYWTESGCDTLWQIDLVTCPHCHWVYDTVAPEDMPVLFNGISFGSETHDEPVYLHIGDTCDSIIYYTLIVIPYWGEKPIDSTWILAPNVITPTQESNNIFSLYCSPHILRAEVTVYDRHGERVARFDGLTGSWDGNADTGQPCRQGTYVYHIRYIDTHDNGWKTLTGTVTLLR